MLDRVEVLTISVQLCLCVCLSLLHFILSIVPSSNIHTLVLHAVGISSEICFWHVATDESRLRKGQKSYFMFN